MPGPVGQYVSAVEDVQKYARNEGENDEVVKEWLAENLHVERQSHPNESYSQALAAAVLVTKHEIKENAQVHWEQEKEEMQERESVGYRMRM